MAFVTQTFKLDITPGASRPVIHASQGDIGRPFKSELYWNGEAWTPGTGVACKIRGKKPDATVFEYDETSSTADVEIDGAAVLFNTSEQMTIIPGPVECELVFNDGVNDIASANFVLIVEDSPYDPDALSESDVLTLADAVAGMVDDAIDAKISAFETEFRATADNIDDGAVITAKIADNAITSEKIKDGEVKTVDIADANVTNAKLAANAVTSDKIADGAVNTADIANNAVTYAKLDPDITAAIREIQAIINRGITTGGVLFSQGAVTFANGRLVLNSIN